MAKGTTGRRAIGSRQLKARPYPLPSINESVDSHLGDCHEIIVKKDWVDATCSVCMEYPHNAVLLLCSSYDKGCRPYMCGTSCRFSNCLDQYKKHAKVTLPQHGQPHDDTAEGLAIGRLYSWNMDKSEVLELPCPLCRGQVKGWTVVKPAREYLNTKKRNCMQENCSYVGVYKELRKHVRVDHPSARPRKVDPLLEQKWSRLEHERERDDVISTIRSSMPGSVVFGDYVIEANSHGFDSDEQENFDANIMELNEDFNNGIDRIESNFRNMFLFLQAFDSAGNIGSNRVSRNERNTNRALNESIVGLTAGNIGSNRVPRNGRNTNRALNESSVGLTGDPSIDTLNYVDLDGYVDEGIQGSGGVSLVNRSRRHHRSHYYSDQDGDSDEGILASGLSLVNRLQSNRRSLYYPDQDGGGDGDEGILGGGGVSLANRLRRVGRVPLGRSGRRQRHREANRNRR
ncbi:hypothetical protein LIER_27227 [Lithospermum erythrorhizon]|uniref:Uncharacterized protein n=1 Tax=Lithospermum erythrorhizon TaxID=34254 RepID=A0AAV3RF80_LITER